MVARPSATRTRPPDGLVLNAPLCAKNGCNHFYRMHQVQENAPLCAKNGCNHFYRMHQVQEMLESQAKDHPNKYFSRGTCAPKPNK
jgi:hypothetical protein